MLYFYWVVGKCGINLYGGVKKGGLNQKTRKIAAKHTQYSRTPALGAIFTDFADY